MIHSKKIFWSKSGSGAWSKSKSWSESESGLNHDDFIWYKSLSGQTGLVGRAISYTNLYKDIRHLRRYSNRTSST